MKGYGTRLQIPHLQKRAAKSLEILDAVAMQPVGLMAGPCSQGEVATFQNPVVLEVETSMFQSIEAISLPLLEGSHILFHCTVRR